MEHLCDQSRFFFDPDLEVSVGLVAQVMTRGDVCRVQRLVGLGINPAAFCIPTRSIPLAALVAPVVRATTAMAMVANTCLGFLVGVSGGDSRLALRTPPTGGGLQGDRRKHGLVVRPKTLH